MRDSPETVYECPVCGNGIKLKNVSGHTGRHRNQGEVDERLEEWVYGLEYVADQVLARIGSPGGESLGGAQDSRGTRLARKPHVQKIIEKAKRKGRIVGDPAQSKRADRPGRNLPDYDQQKGRNDLFSSGRVVSGGGPGTGKRR